MDFNSLINRAKDFARKNPDKVRQGVDRAESVLNERTGGKYSDQIKKGGDAVEGQLGVPDPNAQQRKDDDSRGSRQEPSSGKQQADPQQEQATDATGEQPTGDRPQGQQPTPPQ